MLDEALVKEIETAAGQAGVRQASLARFTSFGSGGPAAFVIAATGHRQLARMLHVIEKHGVSWFVMGKGSNLLVADEGFDGIVINLSGELTDCQVREEGLVCGAGVTLARVANIAVQNSLSGMEALAHIPGTLGGAVIMNAGAFGHQIGDLVEQVEVCGPGECRVLGRDALEFGYRCSNLTPGIAVTRVTLVLAEGEREEIGEKTLFFRHMRSGTQPRGKRTFGSVFKNPPGGLSAGKLLDDAGCKNLSVGGAAVSGIHANFIINNGGAASADVIALMNLCRHRVHREFDIILEPEVRFLGNIEIEKL